MEREEKAERRVEEGEYNLNHLNKNTVKHSFNSFPMFVLIREFK